MSKYTIINGQMYEIPDSTLIHWGFGKARDDHKYVKREWKNGRWRYYYDLKQYSKDKIGVTAKENMNKYKSQYDKQIKQIEKNKRTADLQTYAKKMRSFNENVSKYEFSIAKSKLDAAKKVQARNEEMWSRARDKMDNHDKILDAKTKADDALQEAKIKYELKKASKVASEMLNNDHSYLDKEYNTASAALVEGIKTRGEIGKKYVEARKEYLNTPLGKLETASKKIEARVDSAKDYIHELVTNERGEKARRELVNASNDLRNALAKEDSRRKKYEEVLSKTRKQEYFDKDHGNTAMVNEWKKDADEARAESKAALERVKEAREAYDATPLGKREKRANKRNKR